MGKRSQMLRRINARKKMTKGLLNKKLQEIFTNWELAEEVLKKNIMEFLLSKDRKTRFTASIRFADFILPRRTLNQTQTIASINININQGLNRFDNVQVVNVIQEATNQTQQNKSYKKIAQEKIKKIGDTNFIDEDYIKELETEEGISSRGGGGVEREGIHNIAPLKNDDPISEDLNSEDLKNDDPISEDLNSEDLKNDDPISDDLNSADLNSDDLNSDDQKKDENPSPPEVGVGVREQCDLKIDNI